MKVIGITGGVGSGKSKVVDHIAAHYPAVCIKADELAAGLKEPGERCYRPILDLLGEEILEKNSRHIDNKKMAERIFSDPELLAKVNKIIHPAVKEEILGQIETYRSEGSRDFFILEAALLINDGYDSIVDSLWYIRADRKVREQRLSETRGYSPEKSKSMMDSQLPDEVFLEKCQVVIDNSGDFEETIRQIEKALEQK
ncbi:MAG: dephospho-CoA kinase [Lachnospiraceae bacterium]|nr:dephospho-CoA kinase [Lachnospiraceae bacterium]